MRLEYNSNILGMYKMPQGNIWLWTAKCFSMLMGKSEM